MNMYYCSKCKTTDGPFIKLKRKVLADGTKKQYYYCNTCNSARHRSYRQTESGKQTTRRAVIAYESRNIKRRPAWNKAKSLGTKPCEVCDESKTDKHHPDINKPLEVIWLCRYHHKQAHRALLMALS